MDWVTKRGNYAKNRLSNFLYKIGAIDHKLWRGSFLETE